MSNDPSILRSVRLHLSSWERFKERCAEDETTPNAKLNDLISGYNHHSSFHCGELSYVQPRQRAKAQAAKNAFAKTITERIASAKPIGFDAANGEQIFKRGVGPQKGKK